MVLGGGGSPSPKAEIIVQLGFVAALLAWFWWAPKGRGGQRNSIPRPLLWLGAGLLALPLFQLIPLPPAIWQSLPGRSLEKASLDLVGAAESWRGWSVSPPRTFAAFLALVPAVAMMWATATLPSRDRRFLILSIAVVALAGAGLGALQLAGGDGAFQLYELSHRGWVTAFHANRNAAVDVLLIGSMALSAWFAGNSMPPALAQRRLPILLAGQGVLLIAAILTGSRMGILLILPVLAFNASLLKSLGGAKIIDWSMRGAAVAVLLMLALPWLLSGNARLAGVASRFDVAGDARLLLWRDTAAAIEAFFPVGSGVGTFPIAFGPFESFESLSPASINRAHNDYLEFLLETGMIAPVIMTLGGLALFISAKKAWSEAPWDRAPQIFALGTLAVIALHSFVDYPLRNMAIACLAGAAAGLLSATQKSPRARREAETEK